ncbi:MAG: hypothetical protein GY850_21605, partial [bacterium]|nr:hypothetical protein [bacterium]
MPIYEYKAEDRKDACGVCCDGFETYQKISEDVLSSCSCCGGKIRKTVSLCRSIVVETFEEHAVVNNRITEYERSGCWSHAAELADKQAERTRDKNLKSRALDS